MLRRFTQHTLKIHTVMDFLPELTSHNLLGHVDTTLPESTIGRSSRHPTARTASLLWTDRVSLECSLALACIPEIPTNLAYPDICPWRSCTCAQKHISCSIHSGCIEIITVPLNITNKLNSPTCYTKITQRALTSFLIRRSSLVLVAVSFPECSLALTFTPSSWLWPCPFSAEFDHSRKSPCNQSCGGLFFVYSC